MNWIRIIAFALVASAAVAAVAVAFIIARQRRPHTKREVTVTQEDSRGTQIDELRTAQKRVADLEEIVEDLITVIGPSVSALLWGLRATRANEAQDHEGTFTQDSLTAQIERLTARIRTFESAAGEAIEPNPSASGEPADLVTPTEHSLEGVPVDPAAGADGDTPEPPPAPGEPAEATTSDTVVLIEICRADDTPLVVDLSEPTNADPSSNRTTRQPSSG